MTTSHKPSNPPTPEDLIHMEADFEITKVYDAYWAAPLEMAFETLTFKVDALRRERDKRLKELPKSISKNPSLESSETGQTRKEQ